MIEDRDGLMTAVRDRFHHVETCPFEGERVFFENAGGALTLKSVVETSARLAAIPDNQGRDNPASRALMEMIERGKRDMRAFFNAPDGEVFVGESGTELLFRLIQTAATGAAPGGVILGSTLEHPASRSAAARWAGVTGRDHRLIPHDDETGSIDAAAYARHVTPDVRVATIVHTSPVTGMGVDVAAVAAAIRAVAPDCLIIVDGIQHAAHGSVDVTAIGADGYAISPYKVFSRHGYGVAWASERLTALPHDAVIGGSPRNWELGTRDTAAYATFTDVVEHLDWLGAAFTDSADRRARLDAAAGAVKAHEAALCEAMLHGVGNLKGLAEMPGVRIIGGVDNPRREGLVSLVVDHTPSEAVVEALRRDGVRVHTRKDDHYSGNILKPLGLPSCVRVSLAHYNTRAEVARFLESMARIADRAA